MPSNDDVLSALMTHQAEQPNPAQPYLDATKHAASVASQFIPGYGGGLQGVANQEGIQTPDWSKKLGSVLNSDAANAALGALKLGPGERYGGNNFFHHILNEGGEPVGEMGVRYEPHEGNLHVNSINSDLPPQVNPGSLARKTSSAAHSFGTTDMRSLLQALKDEYPWAHTISGERVSGARQGPGAKGTADVKMKIREPLENKEKMEQLAKSSFNKIFGIE